MAAGDSPGARYEKERKRRLPRAVEKGEITERDGELIEEFLDVIDPNTFVEPPKDIDTVSQSTLRSYAKNVRLVAKASDSELAKLSATDLNKLFSEMVQELARNTVSQRQATMRVFYRYHSELGVDPQLITIAKPKRNSVEARDLFDREEIDAIRKELNSSRERASFDLMVYTGQRIRAIQTLRIKDLDMDEGRFYLNTDAAGLKGAKGMRPMTIARGAVSDWLEDHPAPDDPEAYLFSKRPGAARGKIYDPIYQSTISRPIREACKRAGIDRWEERGHPHNLRHSFVRWAYVTQGMDIETIKWMGGWAQSSNTFETTYFNILDVEHAEKAEKATGTYDGDEEEEADITPEVCPVCDHRLERGSLACPKCGTQLPGAAGLGKKAQEEKESADSIEELGEAELVKALIERNPELLDEIDL